MPNARIMQAFLLVIYMFVYGSAFNVPSRTEQVVTCPTPKLSDVSHVSGVPGFQDGPGLSAEMTVGRQTQRRRRFLQRLVSSAGVMAPAFGRRARAADDGGDVQTASSAIDPSVAMPKITSKVYLDVKFTKYKEPKRLVVGLFGEAMPRTAENFASLCAGDNADGRSYAGTTFYRALSGNSIQGGAIGSPNTGRSGQSSLEGGKTFPPDNFDVLHSRAGLVSAVRNTNGEVDSRFFVQTEDDAGWADGRYAAFGIVLEEGGGMDLVKRISNVDVKTPQNSPKDPITIVACGRLDS